MKKSHRKLEQQLKVLACHRRLAILAYLKRNKTGIVSDIADDIGIRIETASQHLAKLKAAEIVEYNKRGRYATYRLSLRQEEPVKKVIGML